MPRYGNEERFTQTWYSNPPYPTTLEEIEANHPQYAMWAAAIAERYPNISKIAIAGAGFGGTVYYLFVNHGKDAWGCDISWVTQGSAQVLKQYSNRMVTADILVPADMERWRRTVTGSGNKNNKIPLIVTGDVLPCTESEAEVQTMLTNLRAISTQMMHIISPLDTTTTQTEDMLWRTPEQWRQIIGPNEPIILPSLVEVP